MESGHSPSQSVQDQMRRLERLRGACKAGGVKPVLIELWECGDGILLEMKCSLCKQVVPAPLRWACTEGHPICCDCSVTVPVCPWEPPGSKEARNMCRCKFTPTRLKLYDLIYNKSKFECPFKGNGCKEQPVGLVWERHARDCSHMPKPNETGK